MLPTPNTYSLTAGHAEGLEPLTAFDAALLDANMGNLNLLKVSSIIPPGARLIDMPRIPPGSLVPVAFGFITSSQKGDLISAGVAAGASADSFGVIMEHSGHCGAEETESVLEKMVREAFDRRGMRLDSLVIRSVEHRVVACGCAFAAVALWYE